METSDLPVREPSGRHSAYGFDMEMLVGSILFGGVALSTALITTGIVWNRVTTGRLELEYSIGRMTFFQFLWMAISNVMPGTLSPRSLVDLGLATLMMTPYARVLASLLYFAAERNWKYTGFTAFVFSVLTYSLFLR